ncbi:hypothetical protein D3C86_1025710 [compost metagenome]
MALTDGSLVTGLLVWPGIYTMKHFFRIGNGSVNFVYADRLVLRGTRILMITFQCGSIVTTMKTVTHLVPVLLYPIWGTEI